METAKIFVRERRKVEEKEKKPRFSVVAVTGLSVKFYAQHLRKKELEAIAKATGAELVYLAHEKDGSGGSN